MKHKNAFILILTISLVVSLTVALSAQQGRGTGRVRGTVQDEAGNLLAGVKIVAQHLKFNTLFESISDESGAWAVAGLGTGYFRITASLDGYGTTYHEMRVSQFSRNNPPLEFTLKKIQEVPMNMPAIQDEDALGMFEEGHQFYEQEKYAEAVVKFEEFLERNPTIYQVNINIGNCYRELGEYDKAIATFQKILDKVKEDKGSFEGDESAARALASMGETYMKQGDLEKASEFLKQAIEIFPEDETLAFNIGEIYFQQQQPDKAIEYFKLSIQVNDSWGPPHRQLGYAYLNKGEYKLALDSFKKFLEVAPDDPQAPIIENLIPHLEKMIKK